jgi:hypothetical protein
MVTVYVDRDYTADSGREISIRETDVSQTRWSYNSRQLAVAGRSLDVIKPNPIHGRLLVLV